MKKIYILCIEDEPEVLEAIERDMATLEDSFPLETAENTSEARQVIHNILDQGDHIGLILCDHVMPGENGVDLLIELSQQEKTHASRKVLVTGQAGLDATIEAVNQAELSYYIAKPWDPVKLIATSKRLLTDYILEVGIDPTPYMDVLDRERLFHAIHEKGLISDT
ncbi:MAG: response regulator [Puniceicoccaceae bacterium]|nr:MAG: response regulator [Puniceicoccaceae bacterium]